MPNKGHRARRRPWAAASGVAEMLAAGFAFLMVSLLRFCQFNPLSARLLSRVEEIAAAVRCDLTVLTGAVRAGWAKEDGEAVEAAATPDQHWQKMQTIAQQAAEEFFSKAASSEERLGYKKLEKELHLLRTQRFAMQLKLDPQAASKYVPAERPQAWTEAWEWQEVGDRIKENRRQIQTLRRKAGVDTTTAGYDVRNAFGSTSHDALVEGAEQLYEESDHSFLEQLVEGAEQLYEEGVVNITSTFEASDRQITLIHEEGGPMGASEGPILFARSLVDMLVARNSRVWSSVKSLLLTCAFTGAKHDGSLTTYADDATRRIPFQKQEATTEECE